MRRDGEVPAGGVVRGREGEGGERIVADAVAGAAFGLDPDAPAVGGWRGFGAGAGEGWGVGAHVEGDEDAGFVVHGWWRW